MTHNITVSGDSSPIVIVKSENKFNVTEAEVVVANRMEDLSDFNSSGVQDNYLVAYDSASGTYKTINPDDILSAAVTDPNMVGIPTVFINQMASDLDNKVDLDAGEF